VAAEREGRRLDEGAGRRAAEDRLGLDAPDELAAGHLLVGLFFQHGRRQAARRGRAARRRGCAALRRRDERLRQRQQRCELLEAHRKAAASAGWST
jgi:hypothetical protein